MTLQTISPTGALSSGDYVTYMLTYLPDAITDLSSQVSNYIPDQVATDWYNRWDEVLDGISTRITTLNSDISEIQSQVMMLRDAIAKK